MPDLPRDSVIGRPVAPEAGEAVLAEFPADRAAYWRSHAALAVAGGAAAGLVLLALGNPHAWVGPVAAGLAVGLRAAYLASEALSDRWVLTERRLLGPGGQVVPLSALTGVRPFFGAVQLVTRGGDKHLMKYLADAPAAVARIDRARGQG